MKSLLIVIAAIAPGCMGEIVGPGEDGLDEDLPVADIPVELSFTSPPAGARYHRDEVEPSFGWRVADVGISLAITGSPAAIDLSTGDVPLGSVDMATGTAAISLITLGPTLVTATARDADGAPLATAAVEIEIAEPELATCHEWLDLYGALYDVGPDRPGVDDPVTLTLPINGMRYRAYGAADPRTTFFMDCSLARSLLEASPHLRERGIVEVTDIGVYNYRCIGGEGTPPDCPRGMSQHAYAKGIDLAILTDLDGTTYSVNDDWVIDPSGDPTCDAATATEADALLHDTICALKRDQVWNVVLTPNYNADHRNHFHVDLTAGSDFIRRERPLLPDDGPDRH